MTNFYKITITLNLSNNISYDEVFLLPTSKVSKQSALDCGNSFAQSAMQQFKLIVSTNVKIVEKSYKRIPKGFKNPLQD